MMGVNAAAIIGILSADISAGHREGRAGSRKHAPAAVLRRIGADRAALHSKDAAFDIDARADAVGGDVVPDASVIEDKAAPGDEHAASVIRRIAGDGAAVHGQGTGRHFDVASASPRDVRDHPLTLNTVKKVQDGIRADDEGRSIVLP